MEWCWKWVLLNIAAIHSSMASHLWWTFPSISLKCPPKLQQTHWFVDGVGCFWYGESGRIQGNVGIPLNCSMAYCHSWVWMVIQTLWKSSLVPWSLHVWNCLEVSWQSVIWWSSHLPQWSWVYSNRIGQCPVCAMDGVEPYWCFQPAWKLWKLTGKFHTFPQSPRCHHWSLAKTLTLMPSACTFPLLGDLHGSVPRFSFEVWKAQELWNPWLQSHLWQRDLPWSSSMDRALVEAAFSYKAIHLKCNVSEAWV